MTEFESLCLVVKKLRDPETGCPWDRALTHEELKPTCIEEAAEVICGVNILRETGNPEGLQEELGDLLLQVIMHAQIAEEEGLFNMDDVCRTVREKMVRRHPHAFSRRMSADRDMPSKADCQLTPSKAEQQSLAKADRQESPSEAEQQQLPAEAEQQTPEQLSWDAIKRQEKAGKEWMDAYLPDAMLEARELVDRARRRKGFLTEADA